MTCPTPILVTKGDPRSLEESNLEPLDWRVPTSKLQIKGDGKQIREMEERRKGEKSEREVSIGLGKWAGCRDAMDLENL